MEDKFKMALKARVIPVVAIHDANNTDALAESLIEGGLSCAEITFRTDAATKVIKRLATRSDLIVGAGTVIDTEQVKQAIDRELALSSPHTLTKKSFGIVWILVFQWFPV